MTKKPEFVLFFLSRSALLLFSRFFFFALPRFFIASRLRVRKREKSAGAQLY
jgi:hypothetical protein